jgi:hypothetical protein
MHEGPDRKMAAETGRALVVWRAGGVTAGRATSAAAPPVGEAILRLARMPPPPKDRRRSRRLASGLGLGRVIDLEA